MLPCFFVKVLGKLIPPVHVTKNPRNLLIQENCQSKPYFLNNKKIPNGKWYTIPKKLSNERTFCELMSKNSKDVP
jgi:hypothetical protein